MHAGRHEYTYFVCTCEIHFFLQLLGRTLRVDHVLNYRPPKEHGDEDDITKSLRDTGCAPKIAPSSEEEEMPLLPIKKKKSKY